MNTSSTRTPLVVRLAEMRFFSFSLLAHMIVLLVFGGIVITRQMEEQQEWGNSTDPADNSWLIEEKPELAVERVEISAPEAKQVANSEVSVSTQVVDAGGSMGALTVNVARPVVVTTGLGGLGKAVASGMGAGSGLGMTAGSTMRMFGTASKGQSVVVVVDVSGSMVRGAGKSAATYEELEKEVGRVLHALPMSVRFGLVVFSREARSYRTGLTQATTGEKDRALAWLRRHSATVADDAGADAAERAFHHGTRADLGLAEALALNPDTVFFVSDGEPTGVKAAGVLEQVAQAQKERVKPATIHAIAYLADSGQKFLMQLAEANGGMFQEVRPGDVK